MCRHGVYVFRVTRYNPVGDLDTITVETPAVSIAAKVIEVM